jgi:ABC-2 type transport system ATP-binding protein
VAELEVRNLTKRYGKTVAVDDLSFAVEAGRVTGFLGPNGAGKTTMMRALLGCCGRAAARPWSRVHRR